jgi:hypothetical protein
MNSYLIVISAAAGAPLVEDPPTIDAFVLPELSDETVAVTTLTASADATHVLVTESALAPSVGDPGWLEYPLASPPYVHTTALSGAITLYAWAKGAGGVSVTPATASTDVTCPDGWQGAAVFRADRCLVDTDGIFTSWTSMGGNGEIAIAGLDPPTVAATWSGGEKCVVFDSSVVTQTVACDALVAIQNGNDLPCTIIVQWSRTAQSGSRALCGWGHSSGTLQFWPEVSGDNNWYCFRYDASSYAGPLRPDTAASEHYVAIRFTGTAIQVYSDGAWGTEQTLNTASLATVNRFRLGGIFFSNSAQYGMTGKIRQFLVKAGVDSTAQIDAAIAWLEAHT